MSIVHKEVLLLKARNENEDDKYEIELVKHDFTVKHLQLLDFQYINLDLLLEKLNNVDVYNGIIFTSPRAVFATKLSLNHTEHDEKWNYKNNYVVGESTFDLVNNELKFFCRGKDSGNANNLANLIISESEKDTNYLFPSGNLKKETLIARLTEHNIKIDAITVYETIQNKTLIDDLKSVTANFKNIPEYIVYFSPSGVKLLTNILKEYSILFDKLKFVAIGPSTEDALKNENLPVYSVASKPNDKELVRAILKTAYFDDDH